MSEDWKSILANVPDYVLRVDFQGRIQYLNRTLPQLRMADVMGKPVFDYTSPEYHQALWDAFEYVRKHRTGTEYISEAEAAGGGKAFYLNRVGPVFEGDELVSLAIIASEITEKKLAEERLIESEKRLRDLSQKLVNLQEQERKRIALELHDEIGQFLTVFKIDLSWLRKNLGGSRVAMNEKLNTMERQIDHLIDYTRRISSELRPPQLDVLGLNAAVEWQKREFEKKTGLVVDLNMNQEDFEVDKETSITLFRILQEALTNVARHAKANAVRVNLLASSGRIQMSVEDDGIGLDPEKVWKKRSVGLLGMRERASSLGGTFHVGLADRGGTRVETQIPVQIQ